MVEAAIAGDRRAIEQVNSAMGWSDADPRKLLLSDPDVTPEEGEQVLRWLKAKVN